MFTFPKGSDWSGVLVPASDADTIVWLFVMCCVEA